jgi:outer membrane biosynthesis protein TonB
LVRALSGEPLFANAAIEAAKQWKWKPATEAGEPISVTTQLTFNFEPANK